MARASCWKRSRGFAFRRQGSSRSPANPSRRRAGSRRVRRGGCTSRTCPRTALRAAGCAILIVSSELDEILTLADRVLVMNAGRITGERSIEACTEAELGLMMGDTGQAEKAA